MSRMPGSAFRRDRTRGLFLPSGPAGHTAASFVSIATWGPSSGVNDTSVGNPSGATTGDLLIAVIGAGNGSSLSMSAAGGQSWTEITQWASAGGFRAWYCLHNGSLGTVTMSQSNSNTIAAMIVAYRGVDQTTPIDTTPTAALGSGSNVGIPSLTTSTDHVRRVVMAYFNNANGGNAEWYSGEPAGFTKRAGVASSSNAATIYCGDIDQAAAAASPTESFVNSNVFRYVGHIALRPA